MSFALNITVLVLALRLEPMSLKYWVMSLTLSTDSTLASLVHSCFWGHWLGISGKGSSPAVKGHTVTPIAGYLPKNICRRSSLRSETIETTYKPANVRRLFLFISSTTSILIVIKLFTTLLMFYHVSAVE